MHAAKDMITKRGRLVAFEGIDRAGKSCVVAALPGLIRDCRAHVVLCSELKSPIARALRGILCKGGSPFLKTFFFAADRAWEYEAECLPALARGDLVLWDRYVDSAIVYRKVELSRGDSGDLIVDMDFVKVINSCFTPADLTVYIDISVETSIKRVRKTGAQEPYNREFLESARNEYIRLAAGERYSMVDGEGPLESVVTGTARIIRARFREMFP